MALKRIAIHYTEGEDGMLYPELNYPMQPQGSVGKYGEMRREYLAEHRKATYAELRLEGTLKRHLMDVNEQAYQMLDHMIEEMLKSNPAPSRQTDQLGWVQYMNALKAQVEEVVLRELIYV